MPAIALMPREHVMALERPKRATIPMHTAIRVTPSRDPCAAPRRVEAFGDRCHCNGGPQRAAGCKPAATIRRRPAS